MTKSLKCVVLGDGAVGKTCLLMRYGNQPFPTEYAPTIFDSYSVEVPIRDETYELYLFDTTGQEAYDQIRKLALNNTDVILLCYSIGFPSSFDNIKEMWIPEIHSCCPGVPYILVGTKMDLRNDPGNTKEIVTKEAGEHLAKQIKAEMYKECSALTKENVNDVFLEAILIAISKTSSPSQGTNTVGTRNMTTVRTKSCCCNNCCIS